MSCRQELKIYQTSLNCTHKNSINLPNNGIGKLGTRKFLQYNFISRTSRIQYQYPPLRIKEKLSLECFATQRFKCPKTTLEIHYVIEYWGWINQKRFPFWKGKPRRKSFRGITKMIPFAILKDIRLVFAHCFRSVLYNFYMLLIFVE